MMRYNNIINGLLVIASITAFAACTEDTYDNSAAEGNGVFNSRAFQASIREQTYPPTTIRKHLRQVQNTSYSLSKMTTGMLIIYRKPQARTQ